MAPEGKIAKDHYAARAAVSMRIQAIVDKVSGGGWNRAYTPTGRVRKKWEPLLQLINEMARDDQYIAYTGSLMSLKQIIEAGQKSFVNFQPFDIDDSHFRFIDNQLGTGPAGASAPSGRNAPLRGIGTESRRIPDTTPSDDEEWLSKLGTREGFDEVMNHIQELKDRVHEFMDEREQANREGKEMPKIRLQRMEKLKDQVFFYENEIRKRDAVAEADVDDTGFKESKMTTWSGPMEGDAKDDTDFEMPPASELTKRPRRPGSNSDVHDTFRVQKTAATDDRDQSKAQPKPKSKGTVRAEHVVVQPPPPPKSMRQSTETQLEMPPRTGIPHSEHTSPLIQSDPEQKAQRDPVILQPPPEPKRQALGDGPQRTTTLQSARTSPPTQPDPVTREPPSPSKVKGILTMDLLYGKHPPMKARQSFNGPQGSTAEVSADPVDVSSGATGDISIDPVDVPMPASAEPKNDPVSESEAEVKVNGNPYSAVDLDTDSTISLDSQGRQSRRRIDDQASQQARSEAASSISNGDANLASMHSGSEAGSVASYETSSAAGSEAGSEAGPVANSYASSAAGSEASSYASSVAGSEASSYASSAAGSVASSIVDPNAAAVAAIPRQMSGPPLQSMGGNRFAAPSASSGYEGDYSSYSDSASSYQTAQDMSMGGSSMAAAPPAAVAAPPASIGAPSATGVAPPGGAPPVAGTEVQNPGGAEEEPAGSSGSSSGTGTGNARVGWPTLHPKAAYKFFSSKDYQQLQKFLKMDARGLPMINKNMLGNRKAKTMLAVSSRILNSYGRTWEITQLAFGSSSPVEYIFQEFLELKQLLRAYNRYVSSCEPQWTGKQQTMREMINRAARKASASLAPRGGGAGGAAGPAMAGDFGPQGQRLNPSVAQLAKRPQEAATGALGSRGAQRPQNADDRTQLDPSPIDPIKTIRGTKSGKHLFATEDTDKAGQYGFPTSVFKINTQVKRKDMEKDGFRHPSLGKRFRIK